MSRLEKRSIPRTVCAAPHRHGLGNFESHAIVLGNLVEAATLESQTTQPEFRAIYEQLEERSPTASGKRHPDFAQHVAKRGATLVEVPANAVLEPRPSREIPRKRGGGTLGRFQVSVRCFRPASGVGQCVAESDLPK